VPATVSLDGLYRGEAPLRLQGVPPGLRKLAIKAGGYQPVTRDVDLRPGVTLLVDVALVPEPPALQRLVAPDAGSAQVAPIAPAPSAPSTPVPAPTTTPAPAAASTPVTPHHRKAQESSTRSGGEAAVPVATSPRIAPAPPAAIAPGTPGTLAISTVPWSMIFIDGRDIGRSTPLLGYPIAPGWHEIRLQAASGQVDVERVLVAPGQAVRLSRRFQ